MAGSRSLLPLLGLVLLHALARQVDRALGLVLLGEIRPGSLPVELARALVADGAGALLLRTAALVGAAVLALVALSLRRARGEGGFSAAIRIEARSLLGVVGAPLLLRPTLTLAAVVSVGLEPSHPYAFTLPVALTQDLGLAQDLLALAVAAASAVKAPRFAVPRGGEVLLLSFLGYVALVPSWAWHWDSHPGNEPKTLRQAVALGHWLIFDSGPVTGPMESLDTRPLGESLAAGAGTFAAESVAMLSALLDGAAGRDAIQPSRIARQVVRGKEGGVYSVLAPGPSLLLAPTLRADRAVNQARGVPGRVAVSVLLFCLMGALTVWATHRLVGDATGSEALAAALALFFALVPPFLFYFHQFYPELLGALVLALAFRVVALRPELVRSQPLRLGALLATLPWLHQKFLPVWGVLAVTAFLVGWRGERAKLLGPAGWKWAAWLVAPNAASLYLFALYNFAVTGSVRPDALFLAWGPGGVSSARVGQGLLGLLLDSRFGLLPYVPLLVLAGAGLALGGARRFAAVLPAAAAYYLTVASADNWSGAVCNLGRYLMPLVPLGIALVGLALARTAHRRGVLALALALTAWTAAFAVALRADPHAANDSWLLLAKSAFADGRQYIPGLFIRTWANAAPGLAVQLTAWFAVMGAAAFWVRRAAAGVSPTARANELPRLASGDSPLRVLVGLSAVLLTAAFVLERMVPSSRTGPAWQGELRLDADRSLFVEGEARVRADEVLVGPGAVRVLLRARSAVNAPASDAAPATIVATIGGNDGFVHIAGRPPQALRPSGALVEIPLRAYHVVRGEDANAVFLRGFLWLEREALLRPQSVEPGASEVR